MRHRQIDQGNHVKFQTLEIIFYIHLYNPLHLFYECQEQWNVNFRYGDSVYRQVIRIPMGTNCAPMIADLFLYCYESQFMAKISKDPSKQHLIEKFNNTFRYLDDILALNITTSVCILKRSILLNLL